MFMRRGVAVRVSLSPQIARIVHVCWSAHLNAENGTDTFNWFNLDLIMCTTRMLPPNRLDFCRHDIGFDAISIWNTGNFWILLSQTCCFDLCRLCFFSLAFGVFSRWNATNARSTSTTIKTRQTIITIAYDEITNRNKCTKALLKQKKRNERQTNRNSNNMNEQAKQPIHNRTKEKKSKCTSNRQRTNTIPIQCHLF